MFALISILAGAAVGAAGTTAWLLSEPGPGLPTTPNALNDRLAILQTRFKEAVAEGQQAGAATEARLQGELDAMRKARSRTS